MVYPEGGFEHSNVEMNIWPYKVVDYFRKYLFSDKKNAYILKSEILFPKFCSFILITMNLFLSFLFFQEDLGIILEFESYSLLEISHEYFYISFHRLIEYHPGKRIIFKCSTYVPRNGV